ncbi:AbrB/MazE/SpoVT family DNA-binding domain-containing protein [Bosea sp. (in: a-proteobacteria)]|uniref:AbrB/MazE/SpoVT family DNA-binding domain-containing protein n=1 Tax=Bosea sp. (in: a-proteobacteria) TaxID=1871050 RepID=UPI003F718FA6
MNEAVKPAEADAVGDLVQLRKIGNSVGLILTKDILARFRLAEGTASRWSSSRAAGSRRTG